MERSAAFSPCGEYRYRLRRRWGTGPRLAWVMLNPSTADGERDDPTIRRCIGFSRAWGYGAMEVVNLYALRATDPRVLRAHRDPVGPENDAFLRAAARRAARVIVAWGAAGPRDGRADEVARILRDAWCLGMTRDGSPRHPLYASGSASAVRWPLLYCDLS